MDRTVCDLSRPRDLPDIIREAKPNVIVNAAAYTAVDKAEEEEELATLVNGTAAGVMAEEARRIGALFVHYSTDYVFDGAKDSPYTEDDRPSPINAYGRSKLVGAQDADGTWRQVCPSLLCPAAVQRTQYRWSVLDRIGLVSAALGRSCAAELCADFAVRQLRRR